MSDEIKYWFDMHEAQVAEQFIEKFIKANLSDEEKELVSAFFSLSPFPPLDNFELKSPSAKQ